MSVNDYKQCKLNPAHFYLAVHGDECPYCKEEGIIQNDGTMLGYTNSPSEDSDATILEGQEYPSKKEEDVDEIIEDGTLVYRSQSVGDDPNVNTKRIVGWLISYDFNKNGMDYKLYEGRNKFGSSTKVSNSIPGDKGISDTHFTIIFRNNKFALKDEESTNGTFLNGKSIDLLDNVVKLEDKSIIKAGNTTLYFRSAVIE